MKKKYILKENLEFQKIINKKQQLINKFIIIYYIKNNDFEIGISTPKKFANAVKRNLIKRQIKWILDSYIDYKNIKYKIVLIVRKDYFNLTIEEKKKQIIRMFMKLNQG
ncbi:MAG: ribonuclease P protein component [Mycoplasma sp.]|nr:ribonuclease P protein component [Mycoplasma sp.]